MPLKKETKRNHFISVTFYCNIQVDILRSFGRGSEIKNKSFLIALLQATLIISV